MKRSTCGKRRSITRAMKHAYHHKPMVAMLVIDSVSSGKTQTESWRELLTRGPGQRKMAEKLARIHDLLDNPSRDRLRSLGGEVGPNFCNVRPAARVRRRTSGWLIAFFLA